MNRQADALVIFGVTGDLARKQIFPALYTLAKARCARGTGRWRGRFKDHARGDPGARRTGRP
jgi:glucose-6-phosphate 1-dehydrogenase